MGLVTYQTEHGPRVSVLRGVLLACAVGVLVPALILATAFGNAPSWMVYVVSVLPITVGVALGLSMRRRLKDAADKRQIAADFRRQSFVMGLISMAIGGVVLSIGWGDSWTVFFGTILLSGGYFSAGNAFFEARKARREVMAGSEAEAA